ncbi:unnamed protein product [Euphydryas editha]|uniref:Reverse transcriptase n=1 Tax=Euphydryas editha TaxID=104508 RepID=A0AAU9UMV0_EUPED|nr:unnamed protein product [Euphydryas editha]
MTSSVAPVVANLWMEHVEEIALRTVPITVLIWKKYVNDVIGILPGNNTGPLRCLDCLRAETNHWIELHEPKILANERHSHHDSLERRLR